MESFALWYERYDKIYSDPINCEVHVNFWTELGEKKENKNPFIDFGIKVDNLSPLKKIKLFIPFEITKDDIEDLGIVLKDKDVLDAVFNGNYTVVNSTISKQFEVKVVNAPDFNVYELSKSNDINVEKNYMGTLIEININFTKNPKNKIYYFRLRVKSKLLLQILKKYEPSNVFLQSAVSYTRALNFRFNDVRTLDRSLIENMDNEGKFNIEKLHFLLLTKADTDIASMSYSSERELEKGIWDKYVGFKLKKNIVAYHWKFYKPNEVISDVILFVKMKCNKCNWLTIISYILVLAILSIAFNLFSSCIYERLGQSKDKPSNSQIETKLGSGGRK